MVSVSVKNIHLGQLTHEDSDYTAMNAIMHKHLGAKTDPGGELVSASARQCMTVITMV